ncbi:MAG: efflux RND transporter permease subunit [Lachnospiraceae bacterium]|nr:efflux RND transporter permease subunit [Lachnospiraceae bacterium]
MHRLTKAVIERPVTVIVTLVGLVLFSIISVRNMNLKLMPDMSLPMVVVVGTYTGASPEEVDENLIEKIRESCATLSGLKRSQAQSSENYGLLMMQFDYGVNMDDTINDIRNKLDAIDSELPDAAGKPTIIEMDMDSMDDFSMSLYSDSEDLDLLKLVNDTLEPQLRRSSALADITVNGGDESYIAIRMVPEYMQQYGVTSASLVAGIQSMNFMMPAGSFAYGNQHINMETQVHYNELEEIRQIPITTARGQTIHLEDVADVSYGISESSSVSRYNGNNTINVSIKKKQSATAVALSSQVKRILKEFEENYPDVHVDISYDASDEIVSTLKSVAVTMVEGVALAMAVIFLFFGDLKGSIIVGTTMPISLLAAVVCMYFFGISLDVVSMNSLVISIGMITDNAVVVIELCFKKQEEGMGFKDAAYYGSKTVMNSVIGSTLTTVVVYLPLAVMKGLSGQLFKEVGYTIVFVLLASLISAITFVPFFFSVYKPVERQNNPVTRFINWVAGGYTKVLRWMLNRKKLVSLTAVAMFIISMVLASGLGTELMSASDEGIVDIKINFRPNMDLDSMDAEVRRIEDYINEKGLTEKTSVNIDRDSAEASITTYKKEDVDTATQLIADTWNSELAGFSDICEVEVSSGSSMMGGLSSGGASEVITIAADDMEGLREANNRLADLFRNTKGVLAVTTSLDKDRAKALVDIKPELAASKGFSVMQVSQMVYAAMTGSKAGQVSIDGKNYDVQVEYPKGYFSDLDDVQSMTLMSPTGVSVPLTEIADIRFEQSSQTIQRMNGRYISEVTALMTEADHEVIMADLQPSIDALDLGEGANYVESIEDEMMVEEFSAIGVAIVVGLYLVFMVMAMQFESVTYSLLIMLCIPFAMIGSVLMLLIMDVKISMTSLMGVLMLAGIVVNNGIIYIDTANQFRDAGEEVREALMHAGRDRLRPILITTLTTELSMLPVAFGLAKNAETMQGMGVVIVGGLFASTLLTLLLLPTFYLMLDKIKNRKKYKAMAA